MMVDGLEHQLGVPPTTVYLFPRWSRKSIAVQMQLASFVLFIRKLDGSGLADGK
jgi:hypothetical protein